MTRNQTQISSAFNTLFVIGFFGAAMIVLTALAS